LAQLVGQANGQIFFFIFLIKETLMFGKTGNIVLGILLALSLYIFVSGYYLHQRQKFTPLLTRNCRVPSLCFISDQKIPKHIYRLVETETKKLDKAWTRTAAYNPTYTQHKITVQDAETIFVQHFPKRTVDAFHSINPLYKQCKLDVLRYAIMYVFGGVFLENDCFAQELCKLIEPGDEMLLSPWAFPVSVGFLKNVPLTGDYQQWWMVVSKGHPFLKQLMNAITYSIENFNPMLFPTGREAGIHLTGGDIFTMVVNRLEREGMTEFRVVCPDGNGLMRRMDHGWSSLQQYPNTNEPIVMAKESPTLPGSMTAVDAGKK